MIVTGRISVPGYYDQPVAKLTVITSPAKFSWRVREANPPSKLWNRAELVATYGETDIVLATAMIETGRTYMYEIAETP